MQWLLLGVLGIIWAAFLIPVGRRRSDSRSVEDFERWLPLRVDPLADCQAPLLIE